MEADRRAGEEHQAKLDWYKNRDEQNAEKVAIQRFNAEVNAAYKDATLDEKKRMNDIMADVYAGRISLMEAQARLANVRADNGGSSQGNYGYKIVEGYDGSGNKVKERIPTSGGGASPHRRSDSKTNLLPKDNQQQGGSLLPKKQ